MFGKMSNTFSTNHLRRSAKILKFIGLCPFYSDVSKESSTCIFVLYSALLYIGFLCLIFFSCRAPFQTISARIDFTFALKLVEIAICFCWLVFTPLFYWIWSRKLSNYLSMWATFELSVPAPLTGEKSDEHFSFKSIKKSGLLFAIVMIAHFSLSLQIRYLLVYGLMVAFYLSLCLWLQNCIIIDTFIRRLNRFIKNPNLQYHDLNCLLHYWMEFCSIVNASNALFSHLLCLLLFAQGVLFMLNSYTVLSRLLLTTSGEYCQCTSLSAIIIAFTSWNIYSVCDISHIISQEIKSNIQTRILFSSILHLNFSLLTKIRRILEIINLTAPNICIFTCFRIDRKLLVSLISISTTYVILLIQFRLSSHDYKPGSSILDTIFRNRTTK